MTSMRDRFTPERLERTRQRIEQKEAEKRAAIDAEKHRIVAEIESRRDRMAGRMISQSTRVVGQRGNERIHIKALRELIEEGRLVETELWELLISRYDLIHGERIRGMNKRLWSDEEIAQAMQLKTRLLGGKYMAVPTYDATMVAKRISDQYVAENARLWALLPGPEVIEAIRDLVNDAAQMMEDEHYAEVAPNLSAISNWLERLESEASE